MRVRTFFLICMSAICVLAVGAALKLVVDAAGQYRTATSAAEAIDVISQVLLVPEKLTFERLQMTKPLDPKVTPSAEDLGKLAAARKDADATIERGIAAISASAYPSAREELAELNNVKSELQQLRGQADAVIAKPAAQRDAPSYAAFNLKFRDATEELFARIDRIADNVDLVVTSIDNELSGFIELARRSWALRDGGSRRASIYLGPMQAGRPLTPDQLEKLAAADMRMEMNWAAIATTAKRLGDIPVLKNAVAAAREKFYGDSDMVYRAVVAAGRKGEEYPYQGDFTPRHLAGISAPLQIRDASFSIAHSIVAAKKNAAMMALIIAVVMLLLIVGGAAAVVLLLTRRIVSPLAALTAVIARLAQGDHAVEIPARQRSDEIGMMARAIETLRENAVQAERLAETSAAETKARQVRAERIEAATGEFDRASGSVIGSFHEAARSMLEQASDTSRIAQRVEEQTTAVATAVEQAAANVKTVATAADDLSRAITAIGERIDRSTMISSEAQEMANQASREIGSLAEASQQIGAVVDMIQNIASQTNLLALNATIEAARAGESGKGFAVVASEVKTLASQTAKATDEIATQITRIQNETGSAVERVKRLASTIEDTTKLASEIAAAVEKQNAATAEIARNVQQAASGNQLVTDQVGEVSAAMAQSREAASRMADTIGQLSQRAESLTSQISSFLTEMRAA